MRGRAVVAAAVLGGLACGKPAASPASGGPPMPAPPADSLVATAPNGAEIQE